MKCNWETDRGGAGNGIVQPSLRGEGEEKEEIVCLVFTYLVTLPSYLAFLPPCSIQTDLVTLFHPIPFMSQWLSCQVCLYLYLPCLIR